MGEKATSTQDSDSITLELDMGDVEFRSLTELQGWILRQQNFFSWFLRASYENAVLTQIGANIEQWLSIIVDLTHDYATEKEHGEKTAMVNAVNSKLNHYSHNKMLITSSNPKAIFCKKIADSEGHQVAGYALAYLLENNTGETSPVAFKGAFMGIMYQAGSEHARVSVAESLEQFEKAWDFHFRARYIELKEKMDVRLMQTDVMNKKYTGIYQELIEQKEKQKEQFNTLVADAKSELSDIARTYDEKLALQSSVTYWAKKRKSHTYLLFVVGLTSIIFAAVTGLGVIYSAHELLQVKAGELELWRLGVVLAISTFGIWLTRLASKIFVSNLHLRTDADERVTMIQTYLALLREGQGPLDSERQLILQTLFRPSYSGFVKDDGPSSFHEMITSVLAKK